MKSIVLCDRTLVQESEDLKNFKDEKINEGSNEKAEGKKIVNGTSDSKKSETPIQNFEKDGAAVQNGGIKGTKTSFEEEISENDGSRRPSTVEAVSRGNFLIEKADPSAEIEKKSICSEKDELDYSLKENSLNESEILENLSTQNESERVESLKFNSEMDFSVENYESSEGTVQIIEANTSGSSVQSANDDSVRKNIDTDLVNVRKLTQAEIKENVQPLSDIVLDVDENKENEKEEKTIVIDDFSENDLSDKHSTGCEIQVGKVESISGLEKESMWAENEFKKPETDFIEKSEEKLMDESQDISLSNGEFMNIIEEGKEKENREFGSNENLISEVEENLEEGMHIEVEESDQAETVKNEEKEGEKTVLNNIFDTENRIIRETKDTKPNLATAENALSRKRQIFESNEDPSAKKKRLSEDREEPDQVQLYEENTEDSSRCASLSSLDGVDSSSKGQCSYEAKVHQGTKRTLTDEKNSKKLNASAITVEKQGTGDTTFSVLEKFRGTLKTLTRSDLEELIIQKLCEVITERSNVGELRQKAQALEQDQERWKTKAQSLTKQMREMEMVMKKYMSEVQKQIREGNTHVVTPLKVTRSVGLQVSFYSSTSKGSKPNLTPPGPTGLAPTTRNAKSSSPKLSSQFCQVTQNTKNKAASSLQKSPVNQQRRPIAPKPDYSLSASNRSGVQQSLLSNSRGTQNQTQVPRPGYKSSGTSPQQSPQPLHQHQQQKQQPPLHQQQQQNGSKVIDLTEDDDRQTGNTGMLVKTSGSIRVVNHLTQQTPPQNNRFAYLLPTTSAPTSTPAGQNRQVLIATPAMPQPNRQIMCSMPPLLFKGGNVVQTASQPQMLNQTNKVILPKTLRHPAPLPQRPVNQNTRPSLKLLPPRPALKISKVQTGIVLSWNMSLSPEHAPIASYQLYAYQESDSPPATSLWKKVGDVKALPLPMACTLTQFMSGHKYHFAVRAVDLHSRIGPFSFPGTIVLV